MWTRDVLVLSVFMALLVLCILRLLLYYVGSNEVCEKIWNRQNPSVGVC